MGNLDSRKSRCCFFTLHQTAWIDVLRQQYASPDKAAEMYGLSESAEISDWDEFGEVTRWGLPKDSRQGFADQSIMNAARIVEAYLKAHSRHKKQPYY
ncbi:hypothetical protein [Gimesia algae]|uniref:Uncharacterized protein n=1 Tax=Gimesia algae TaxID=2527971 RepID=A0A517VEW2_9PLAN|nr:hypothetical protein [Gimesia algae]QDT91550.1 hypothetical protein Pan161_32090 [Gimesia algae]